MTDWQLGRPCENQIGVMKGKHLLFGARARAGGGCLLSGEMWIPATLLRKSNENCMLHVNVS
jgi:hypothetical protein